MSNMSGIIWLVIYILNGICFADVATYILHRCEHSKWVAEHWLLWPVHSLHKSRHHTLYQCQFQASRGTDPWPSLEHLDVSAFLIFLPVLLTALGCHTVTVVANALTLTLIFVMHAAAHSSDLACPEWYYNHHSAHHRYPNRNFGLLCGHLDWTLGTLFSENPHTCQKQRTTSSHPM